MILCCNVLQTGMPACTTARVRRPAHCVISTCPRVWCLEKPTSHWQSRLSLWVSWGFCFILPPSLIKVLYPELYIAGALVSLPDSILSAIILQLEGSRWIIYFVLFCTALSHINMMVWKFRDMCPNNAKQDNVSHKLFCSYLLLFSKIELT